MVVEEADDDDGEYAAHVGAEDEDDPYNDPARWYDDDDDDAADPQSAYSYWEEEGEWQNFTAYISDEWSKKYDVDATALETVELECVACLFDTLGATALRLH